MHYFRNQSAAIWRYFWGSTRTLADLDCSRKSFFISIAISFVFKAIVGLCFVSFKVYYFEDNPMSVQVLFPRAVELIGFILIYSALRPIAFFILTLILSSSDRFYQLMVTETWFHMVAGAIVLLAIAISGVANIAIWLILAWWHSAGPELIDNSIAFNISLYILPILVAFFSLIKLLKLYAYIFNGLHWRASLLFAASLFISKTNPLNNFDFL